MTLSLDTARPHAPPAPSAGTPPLLVAIRDVTDLDGPFAWAAERARTEQRGLLVAIVGPPRLLTLHAAIHPRHARLVAGRHRARTAAVHRRCADVAVQVVEVRPAWGPTRGHVERSLQRRLATLARRYGAVLVGPTTTARPLAQPLAGLAR